MSNVIKKVFNTDKAEHEAKDVGDKVQNLEKKDEGLLNDARDKAGNLLGHGQGAASGAKDAAGGAAGGVAGGAAGAGGGCQCSWQH